VAVIEATAKTLSVLHLQRRPFAGYFSIEGQFEEIRAHLPPEIRCRRWECPFLSRGMWPRVANVLAARRARADVFHVTGDVHYLALGLPRERTLLTIHDCVFASQTRGLRRWALRLAFYEWAVACAARVTVISETVKRELRELLGARAPDISVVPCCVGARFEYVPRDFPRTPEVLLVGTTRNKNLVRVLSALAPLKCRVHVVGNLSEEQALALERSGLDARVSQKLLGDAMVQAYREADVVSLCSTYEGFGLPILEAQAVGRPVVTSSVYSMPEASGGAAVLVDPNDENAIRAGFARLFDDAPLRKALVSRGLENAAKYAPSRIAAKYAGIYEELAGARN
jgi:glycosyltransferase involved in cell wall biosynthesis